MPVDWHGAGLAIEARPTIGADRLGITGAFCAIAETGTRVIVAGAETPTATTLLPDTHIAILRADRIVAGMEDAFALLRRERGAPPGSLKSCWRGAGCADRARARGGHNARMTTALTRDRFRSIRNGRFAAIWAATPTVWSWPISAGRGEL